LNDRSIERYPFFVALGLFVGAAHAAGPPALFRHLDQAAIEAKLPQEILDEQANKLVSGTVLRMNYVYLDPSPLEAIAAAPDQRGFLEFNPFPGEALVLELRYEASLNTGVWHTIYGASDTPSVITGPQPVAATKKLKGHSALPRLTAVGFSGYAYAADRTYRFLAIRGEPDLYVGEEIDPEYSAGEDSEPLLPPGPAGGPPSAPHSPSRAELVQP